MDGYCRWVDRWRDLSLSFNRWTKGKPKVGLGSVDYKPFLTEFYDIFLCYLIYDFMNQLLALILKP